MLLRYRAASFCVVGLLLAQALACGGCRERRPQATASAERPPEPSPVAPPHYVEAPHGHGNPQTSMRNVHMMIDPEVVLEVRSLRGELQPTAAGAAPYFDDPGSFRIAIERAQVAMSTASLSALLNHYVFAYPGAPLERLQVSVRNGLLHQSGVLHKKALEIRFEMDAELSVTPEGLLRLHPKKVKAAGIPVKKLMDMLGLELDELIKVRPERGLSLQDDDMLLDPSKLVPPPQVLGRVGDARIEGDRVVLFFVPSGVGSGTGRLRPSLPKARNYMFFHGGRLRFGKLTMDDADLQIVDMDPHDPFEFFLSRYLKQLVAGYSKTMPDKGLVAMMPDYDEAR